MDRLDRFVSKVHFSEGCWLWTGAISDTGYGGFAWNTVPLRMMGAHRASWLLSHGEIPSGLNVLHSCDVRRCVRPDHLFIGTQKDNSADMIAKGRQRSRVATETHCVNDHEWTPASTYITPQGYRACRTCRNIGMRKRDTLTSERPSPSPSGR